MGFEPAQQRNEALANRALNNFLMGVEKRAFRMAMVSVRDRDDALDVVQDAMMQLVSKYHHKQQEEWPKLFFRILHNKMMDVHRKRKRQSIFISWFGNTHENNANPVEQAAAPVNMSPESRFQSETTIELLEQAIHQLPARQQQAFMLRCWEGFSTAETAATMDCSEGSVKTHYSRAMHSLQKSLGEHYE